MDHANDLDKAFTERERVKSLAEDYLWTAEVNRIMVEEEQRKERDEGLQRETSNK